MIHPIIPLLTAMAMINSTSTSSSSPVCRDKDRVKEAEKLARDVSRIQRKLDLFNFRLASIERYYALHDWSNMQKSVNVRMDKSNFSILGMLFEDVIVRLAHYPPDMTETLSQILDIVKRDKSDHIEISVEVCKELADAYIAYLRDTIAAGGVAPRLEVPVHVTNSSVLMVNAIRDAIGYEPVPYFFKVPKANEPGIVGANALNVPILSNVAFDALGESGTFMKILLWFFNW